MIHVGVSMPPATWERVQSAARARGPRTSASLILREAVAEYLTRHFGAVEPQPEPPQAVPA